MASSPTTTNQENVSSEKMCACARTRLARAETFDGGVLYAYLLVVWSSLLLVVWPCPMLLWPPPLILLVVGLVLSTTTLGQFLSSACFGGVLPYSSRGGPAATYSLAVISVCRISRMDEERMEGSSRATRAGGPGWKGRRAHCGWKPTILFAMRPTADRRLPRMRPADWRRGANRERQTMMGP